MRRNFPQTIRHTRPEAGVGTNQRPSFLDEIAPLERVESSRADEISRVLEKTITASGLEAGDCLGTKEDLRHRFQVSPATMNEAVRILESRGLIETRRGLRGGVFVSQSRGQVAFGHIARGLEAHAAFSEYCWAVSMQLEPLVVAEAAKCARLDSVAELKALLARMAIAGENPIEVLRCGCLFYRRIAAMGSNPLLTAIYTALLDLLEQSNASIVPAQLLAKCRRLADTIASENTGRAAAGAAQDPPALSVREPMPILNHLSPALLPGAALRGDRKRDGVSSTHLRAASH